MFTWDVDPILLDGAVPLRVYGLLLALALAGGFLLFRWQMVRAGHLEALAGRFLAWGLVGLLVGARVVHCLLYDPARYRAAPLTVFALWQGGLASHGAALGLGLALVLFARRHRLSPADLADRLSFGAALATGLVRVGNFFNSEIVGRPTGGRWGVRFPRHDHLPPALIPPRHPVQLYEAALGLGVLALLLLLDRRLGEDRGRGLLGALFLAIYFGGRVLLECFKEPEGLPVGADLTMGQLLSLPLLLAGAGWLAMVRRDHSNG